VTQTSGEVVQTTTKLKALYALHPPLRVDSESASSLYRKFFKDLGPKRTIPIRGSFTHNGELLAVAVRPCTASQKKRHFSKSPFLQIGDAVLEFSATFEFPGQERFFWTDPTGARIARTREQSILDWKSTLSLTLELTIQSFFCALAIAYEGAVRPTQNVWIQDGSEYGTDRCYLSEIHESIEFLREKNAFPEIDIKLDTVINWTFAQNGIFDGYSDTPVSRALNYFTRLFVSNFRNDELSDLVWALAGIEALLVEGGRSSMGQLREKLGALFARNIDLPWLSKMIADSYNFRSRMIHGDRQIRSFFRSDEEESKKRLDEEYNSQLFAIGMLVLLLRFVISKDLTELRFNTVFEG
jgi:hypothetical protein